MMEVKVSYTLQRKAGITYKPKKYNKEEPYHCMSCNTAWQYKPQIKCEYLRDFPKLGCTVKICPFCKQK